MSASATEIRLPLDPGPLRCSAREVAAVFAALFREMRAAVPHIRPDERDLLRRIMTAPDGPPPVAALFPAFERNSSEHETLRKLRTAHFIRPAGPDRWDANARIEVRPFARLVWDRLGEAVVFGDPPEESDVDLSVPGADEPDPPTDAPKKARWDEDDVLDFLSDPGAPARNPRGG